MTTLATPIFQVDVFASEAYNGAPAGVCITPTCPDGTWMARVAREMACPNTAFAQPRGSGDGYDLRWFTAGGVEVSLCGHATLATAHVLYELGELAAIAPVRFHTQGGVLSALRQEDGSIELNFPLELALPIEIQAPLADALGADLLWVGRNRLDYVIEVANEEVLRRLKPNMVALGEIETRGFVITARASTPDESAYDYVLRFFAPRVGLPEDMVTGTAHCALGPYWRDKFDDGRTRFTAFQASPRGGFVGVRLANERVFISGRAITVLKGELLA
ncbi:MAG: PhzF family phenazine biosynthesis protein [Burkholderiaceae bacterium]|jgi:PhzF family phenazine biosynthesis protein